MRVRAALLVVIAACGFPRPPDLQATTDGNGGSGAESGGSCPTYTVSRDPLTISLLVDRSASMQDAFGTWTKFAAVHSDLTTTTGVVTRFNDIVEFGAIEFDNPDPTMCPELVTVAPGMAVHDQIDALLTNNMPNGAGVLPEALTGAATVLLNAAGSATKVQWVMTDGVPWKCDQSDGMAAATTALTAAFNQGITTRFIALGPDITDTMLMALAHAGAGGAAGIGLRASIPTDLSLAMDQLIATDIPCTFDVSPAITDADAASVVVKLGGIVRDHGANGWMASAPGQLTLTGAACDSFHARGAGTNVTVTCP